MSEDYKYKNITGKIIGAGMQVHSTLENGFKEVIYQRAMEIELALFNLEYKREFSMSIYYKGSEIGTRRVDFLVNDIISVELKAIIKLEDVHLAQAINYLEAYNLEIGLLINFGSKSLEFKRLINSKYIPESAGNNFSVSIIDMKGTRIINNLSCKVTNGNGSINLSGLRYLPGIYIVKVNNDLTIWSKKIKL